MSVRLSLLALLMAATPLAAQDAPPPRQLPPASPPPAERAPVQPTTAPQPPANAVALCGDGGYVVAPALPAACGQRGGLRLTLPAARGQTPADVAPGRAPAQASATLQAPRPPETPPAGATMRCKDGTWLSGTADAARCANNGGLLVILPPARTPPPRQP